MEAPRLLQIKSPLGAGALVVTHLRVTEQLGMPYSIEVEVLGRDPALLPSELLTKEITVTLSQEVDGRQVERHFGGVVAEFHRLGPGSAERMSYKLVAVPGIWRLGLRRNCRIFQGKTVKEIVALVLAEHGQPPPSWGILPEITAIPYCTQFNETDLHFVSRLLEEHGMTYYFSHSASVTTLSISATAPGFPTFAGGDVQATHKAEGYFELNSWRRINRARGASVQSQDMDGERSQPSVTLSKSSVTRTYPDEPAMWTVGESFSWPGGMSTRPGVDCAAVAMGALETASEDYAAGTRDARFAPGVRVSVGVRLEDASEVKQQYVVTAATHEAVEYSGLVAGAGVTERSNSTLTLVAASRAWMPKARHLRPVMAGIHSATVTGPSAEKINVDKFGRIRVRFRWDRMGPNDDTSSCWVRVAQSAAGSWGGTWFLPRVGDEVLVAFLDGDPDRPVVTGSVYGKDYEPPFSPGEHRARSGIRTRSYKSDSADDANIFRFEDKQGSEEILVHAQKDLNVEVENDETNTVGRDQKETVQNSRTVVIKDADDSLTLDKGNRLAKLKVGNDTVTLDLGNETHTLKLGDFKLKCDAGSITLEALQKITLKVGENTVVIDQTGVTVKGLMITEEAQLMHKVKAPMVQQNGDGMVQVQGGVVMLN